MISWSTGCRPSSPTQRAQAGTGLRYAHSGAQAMTNSCTGILEESTGILLEILWNRIIQHEHLGALLSRMAEAEPGGAPEIAWSIMGRPFMSKHLKPAATEFIPRLQKSVIEDGSHASNQNEGELYGAADLNLNLTPAFLSTQVSELESHLAHPHTHMAETSKHV